MRTLQELKALKIQRAERAAALASIATGSGTTPAREFTEAERAELDQLQNTAADLEADIKRAEFLEDQQRTAAAAIAQKMFVQDAGTPKADEYTRNQRNFSITRAAQHVAGIRVDAGLEKEYEQEARSQANAIGLPTTGKGFILPAFLDKNSTASRATADVDLDAGNLIPTNQMSTEMGYKPVLFVEDMGARMLMGLTGINNIPVADLTAVSAFVGEGDAFTSIISNVRRPTLTAKGLMSKLTNSWFLKAQAGPESDRVLLQTLEAAESNAVNKNIIKRANANSSHGFFGAADVVDVSGTNGDAITRDLLISMINAPANNAATFKTAGFIVSPAIREALQTLKTDAGSGLFVWSADSADMLLGYKAAVTTLCPTDLTKGSGSNLAGAVFGYFDQLHVANWAVRELIIDAASNDTGVVLKMVSFWDWALANPKAFSIGYFTV
jgi:HK97 family phage major capsid protein